LIVASLPNASEKSLIASIAFVPYGQCDITNRSSDFLISGRQTIASLQEASSQSTLPSLSSSTLLSQISAVGSKLPPSATSWYSPTGWRYFAICCLPSLSLSTVLSNRIAGSVLNVGSAFWSWA